ncbi:ribonuclease HII [bacterium]|nr:ribonuclease HII [bacterium]
MINTDLEKGLFQKGYQVIAGFDEAGRGAWAGPIIAACVLLRKEDLEKNKELIAQVNDSKKLSSQKREKLFPEIRKNFLGNFGVADNKVIDQIGIQRANVLIMEKASKKFKDQVDIALLDHIGGFDNYYQGDLEHRIIVHGDAQHLAIALASIMAKVYRDQLMINYAKKYPKYFFEKHKGYGTKKHLEVLQKIGACDIHRKSYKPIRILEE